MERNLATLIVDQFESYGIEYVFCVPGAVIMALVMALKGRKPKLILCTSEASAGQAAVAYAKISGKPAVALVTAGPGATNLITAAATATAEHTPLIVICGQVSSRISFRPAHQAVDVERLFEPVAKYSREVREVANFTNEWDIAYQAAMTGPQGAVHLAFARELLSVPTDIQPTHPLSHGSSLHATRESIREAQVLFRQSKYPVIILGGDAQSIKIAHALKELVHATKIGVVATYEGIGGIEPPAHEHFMGRISIYCNVSENALMEEADLFIAIGYNIAELEPIRWNPKNKPLIHISDYLPVIADGYRPSIQLIGDIATNLELLQENLNYRASVAYESLQQRRRQSMQKLSLEYKHRPYVVHPLYVIECLQQVIGKDDLVVGDVGSNQYWVGEYFLSAIPHQFINSMGFQTLGLSIPFAMGAAFAHKKGRVYSISGDGGILFCMAEISTAVQYQLPIIHMIWRDNTYNMVAISEENCYGDTYAVNLNPNIDFIKIAEGLGAHAFKVTDYKELLPIIEHVQTLLGPSLIEIAIDYSDNLKQLSALT